MLSERRESLLKFNKSAIGVIKHFLNAQLHGAGKKSENPMNPHLFFLLDKIASFRVRFTKIKQAKIFPGLSPPRKMFPF